MRSSFVRRGVEARVHPGTRPGLHGSTLISTGLHDLDELLNGGLPLGALLLLVEDGWSGQHLTLQRYFLAEGIACGHSCHWALPAGRGLEPHAVLPAQAGAGKVDKGNEREGGPETELRIAWQYRRYLKSNSTPAGAHQAHATRPFHSTAESAQKAASSARAAGSATEKPSSSHSSSGSGLRQWCHSFDLTTEIGKKALEAAALTVSEHELCVPPVPTCREGPPPQHPQPPPGLLQGVRDFLAQLQASCQPQSAQRRGAGRQGPSPAAGPRSVGRLAILSAGDAVDALENQGCRLLATVQALACMVRDTRAAAMVTVPANLYPVSVRRQLMHMADVVLSLEALEDSSQVVKLAPDLRSCAALVHVHRIQLPGALSAMTVSNPHNLLRHRQRRISIQRIEIDPDAELGAFDAAAPASSNPAAAVVCSGPSARAGGLDF